MNDKELDPTKKSHSREALLEAAERLFAEKGYEAVSTRELAEAAGVNLGAIQYHFGSKAKLFVETVHRMMRGSGCARAQFALTTTPTSAEDAATRLCKFVYSFLGYMLRPQGPQPCRLMIREIFTETTRDEEMYEALVSTVADEYSKPLEDTLIANLRLLADNKSQRELQHLARCILGQCTLYATHRPFIERIMNEDISKSPALEELAEHICRFTLRGLRLPETFIDNVIANASEKV
ncbi:MAG: TetR/AcrR family transcriptional regulator [Deltaproteobacteria bacterium]|nr:TetR/AcrR family transcriptional regulator [Deltaproteobacteria bacterium]